MSEQNVKEKSSSGLPHATLTRALTEGIASGHFPVGSLLPTEFELCELYGASRYAVRMAVAELVALGLVSRRKRAGTRVEARMATAHFRQSLNSLDDLVQFGATHRRKVQESGEQRLDRALAEALGVAEGSRWLRISSLRLDEAAAAPPIGWTDVYLDPAYPDVIAAARTHPDRLVAALVAARHGRHAAEIRQDISVATVTERVAPALRAEPGTPALRIIRRYLDHAGIAFEISDSLHPAGRFTASSVLLRDRD